MFIYIYIYIYCWIDWLVMSCPIWPDRQRKVWINPYLFLRRSHHITSHHITSQRILIGRWCYCYTVAIERRLQFVFSLDLSCVMIWQLIPGHRRKFRLELRKTHYCILLSYVLNKNKHMLLFVGSRMQKRNKHRWIGSFASSSFVFFFILLIATATSWIIQLTTVPETVRTVYYVMLRSCRHERFRWSTIQKVGVHKFDTDNMTQHGDAASWRGLLAYSSDCKTVIPYLYEYGTVVLDRYGFSKSRCTAWRGSARLLFLSMHACMHACSTTINSLT